jgi:hypothetical protein
MWRRALLPAACGGFTLSVRDRQGPRLLGQRPMNDIPAPQLVERQGDSLQAVATSARRPSGLASGPTPLGTGSLGTAGVKSETELAFAARHRSASRCRACSGTASAMALARRSRCTRAPAAICSLSGWPHSPTSGVALGSLLARADGGRPCRRDGRGGRSVRRVWHLGATASGLGNQVGLGLERLTGPAQARGGPAPTTSCPARVCSGDIAEAQPCLGPRPRLVARTGPTQHQGVMDLAPGVAYRRGDVAKAQERTGSCPACEGRANHYVLPSRGPMSLIVRQIHAEVRDGRRTAS